LKCRETGPAAKVGSYTSAALLSWSIAVCGGRHGSRMAAPSLQYVGVKAGLADSLLRIPPFTFGVLIEISISLALCRFNG
jgi:hypothetical protein